MITMKRAIVLNGSVKWRTLMTSSLHSTRKLEALASPLLCRYPFYSDSFGQCGCKQTQTQYRNLSSGSSEQILNSVNNLNEQAQTVPTSVLEYIESVQETGKVAVLFSDAPPVLWAVEALCNLKDLPGMTWISTIICTTVLLRTFVGVPVAVAQTKAMARYENLKPELQKLGDELKMETAVAIKKFKWDQKTAHRQFKKSYKKHWRTLVESNNCHPMRSLALSMTQLPFWIFFSSALRNVVYAVPFPRTTDKIERWIQIHNESTPWVESLVLPDPVVFPTVFLVMNFLNIEVTRRQRLSTIPETKLQKLFPWLIRGGILAIAFIATSVPSAVSMYWATSSSLALAQNLIFASPAVKNILKSRTSTVGLSLLSKTK